jgi:putative methionine-R-sulfoxide reductase with GAF domain
LKVYRSPRELLAETDHLLAARYNKNSPPLESVVETLYRGRHYFWIGIYLVIGDKAVRQAFRGPVPPCHTFALGKGNVGTAGQTGIVKVIPDVSADPTYSMCFLETKSEIVVPIKFGRRVLGVIDVESDHSNAFGPKERVLLEQVARRLAMFLSRQGKYLLRRAREAASQSAASKSEGTMPPEKRAKALATVACRR